MFDGPMRYRRWSSYRILATVGAWGAAVLIASSGWSAETAEPELFPPAVPLRPSTRPPLRLAEEPSVTPLARLEGAATAAPDGLAEIAAWNRERRRPLKVGFARAFPIPQAVTLDVASLERQLESLGARVALAGGVAGRLATGDLVWGASVRVEDSYRLQLHLAQVDVPLGTLFWVYGEDGETVGPFGLELLTDEVGIWTPTVAGPSIGLEVQIPGREANPPASFVLDQVMESFQLDITGAPLTLTTTGSGSTSCLVDAQCVGGGTFGPINDVQKAIARVRFVEGASAFVCTGGLLADTDPKTTIPYLLTANPCISTQSVASTVQAVFDYFANSCNGSTPSLSSRPRVNGATILATAANTDFTLLELSSLPSNRFLLGWNKQSLAQSNDNGKVIHRVSHPNADIQHYSRTEVNTSAGTCQGRPRPRFVYSSYIPNGEGGTFPGSSGSPAMLKNGRVVGQFLGSCGENPGDGCDQTTNELAGALSEYFSSIKQFLDPKKFTLTVNKFGTGSGTVTSDPAGINCGNSCSDPFTDGTVVKLTASPIAPSTFVVWGGDCSGSGTQTTVTMSVNKTCTARFDLPDRTLMVSKTGTGSGTVTSSPAGIDCGGDCTEIYTHGTVVTLFANPDAGSSFAGWSGNSDCLDGTVTMNADKSCVAEFRPLFTLDVTVAMDGGDGTVRSRPSGVNCGAKGADCQEVYLEATEVELAAIPELSSKFAGWSGDADCTDGALTMIADRACTATFDACSIPTQVDVPAQTVTDTQVFQACNILSAGSGVGGFAVTATGDVTFVSGNSIILQSGFAVEGGKFVAKIGPPE